MATRYFPVTWKQYHDLAQKLSASILCHTPDVNQIVAISRGGLTLGHLFSDFLRIPIATFAIQSYADIQTQGEVKITEPLRTSIAGKSVLLVDDISDSGKTLRRAKRYLVRFKPKSITSVTLFYRPQSIFLPDYYTQEVDPSSWIIFPYEITETILNITKSMEKEGKSKADIQRLLKKLGFTEDQIKFVRKYHLYLK